MPKKKNGGEKIQRRIQDACRTSGVTLDQLYADAAQQAGISQQRVRIDLDDYKRMTRLGKDPDPPNYIRTYVNSIRKQGRRQKRVRQLTVAA